MPTLFYTHPVFFEHDTGPHHPENPDRLRAILQTIDSEEFALLDRREAPEARITQIEHVHRPFYVEGIFENLPASGSKHLDPDTVVSPKSGEAALRAAGAVCDAVDQVMTGQARNAFCAVRPPGHHAESQAAMGFCLFNNVMVGAAHARAVYDIDRVAIIDFDVHHGNGTQSMMEYNRNILYCSSHQSPCYPGTGGEREHGIDDNVVNVELAPGSGSDAFREAYERRILPALEGFSPELVMISAGFDGHARDPLAYLRLSTGDFEWVTRRIVAIADKACGGRVVSTLEGGYDLEALSASVAAHLRVLMGN